MSKKFSDFFNSYAKSINKALDRTGGLFETPFKRLLIDNEAYFSSVLAYIHLNPQKHGFVDDFKDYEHSSYHSLLSEKATKLKRDEAVQWFGNKMQYVDFHESIKQKKMQIDKYVIEFD